MRRLTLLTTILALAPAAAASAAPAPYDFNADGRQDVVAGVPQWTENGAPLSGAVIVLPGASRGVSLAERLITQATADVPGEPEGDDALGSTVASADFNGDGYADLASAAPGDKVTIVVPGSKTGLDTAAAQSVPGAGRLVAGDLNRDGYADLVQGDTTADRLDDADYGSGRLRLVFGGAQGLRPDVTRTIARPRAELADFGQHLAVADVDGDKHLDIIEAAAGSTDDLDFGGVPGHVTYTKGAPAGPTEATLVGDVLRGGPTSIAVGDVTGDKRPDLVAGLAVNAYHNEDDPIPPGAVRVYRGAASGLTAKGVTFTQATAGIPGSSEESDAFGAAVAVGRVDGDRYADIVVGASGEDKGAGRVTVVRGAAGGVARTGNVAFGQDSRGIPGGRRAGDGFGAELALLDATGDRRPELVIGAPGDRSLTVLRGGTRGLVTTGVQEITLARLGITAPVDPPAPADPFGAVLGRPASS